MPEYFEQLREAIGRGESTPAAKVRTSVLSRMIFRCAGILLAITGRTACADIIYTLVQPVQFESSPYGFSGTVTTDGSVGNKTTLDFIKSWSITVRTPATVDGVSSELFDPTNSTVSLFVSDTPGLMVTTESIKLSAGPLPLATLTWASPQDETRLQYTNRFGTDLGVSVSDASELDRGLGITAAGSPIASVPEPSIVLLLLIAIGSCICRRHDR
jgi:hypothetical protein